MKSADNRTDPLSVLQLALSTLSFFGCLTIAVLLALPGDSGLSHLRQTSQAAVVTYAWAAALMALVAALSAYFALRRVAGSPVAPRGMGSFAAATVFLLVWPLLIWAGSSTVSGPWIPMLHILCLVIPLWWLFQLARQSLPPLSPQRAWGLAAVSIVLTPAILILLELFFGLIVLLLLTFKLVSAPGLANQLNHILAELQANPTAPGILQEAWQSLVSMPGFIFVLLAMVAGIIPVLEELIKPLGIWFTAGRSNPPAGGWVAGLICGAAFALVESLGVSANFSGPEWVQLVIQRTGTGLLHMTACALVGWGLASAWERKEFLKLIGAFCAAVALHCAWNAVSILLGVQPFLKSASPLGDAGVLSRFLPNSLLALLVAGMLAILIAMNWHLRKEAENQSLPAEEISAE